MGRQRVERVLVTAALIAAAAATAALPASAGQDSPPQCAAGDLTVRIAEGHSPSPATSRLFMVEFKGREGVDCQLSGGLSNVRFFDGANQQMIVPFLNYHHLTPPHEKVHVGEYGAAYVYIKAPKTGSIGFPVARMSFDVPTAPKSEMSTTWPSTVNGPLEFGKIMNGVS
ncbi:hypothetical protein [Lentzea sp. NPDC060358]|uniref:hypothetical protein n=1 Tax=Lentzea sp. NPDC060358 TaxID=3347103 RepID=UPI0036559761